MRVAHTHACEQSIHIHKYIFKKKKKTLSVGIPPRKDGLQDRLLWTLLWGARSIFRVQAWVLAAPTT